MNKGIQFYQQLHSKDNGEIVLIADKERNVEFICKSCEQRFHAIGTAMPIKVFDKDFKNYEPK